ncbi:MAG: UvrD-helicase domain-containing protein [Gammaproteobacteria bacterium]
MREFYPPQIFRKFLKAANWRLTLNDDCAVIRQNGKSEAVCWLTIDKISSVGVIFPKLIIQTKNKRIVLPWLYLASAPKAADALRKHVETSLTKKFSETTAAVCAEIESFYARDLYISSRDVNLWMDSTPNMRDNVNISRNIWHHPLFNRRQITEDILLQWRCCDPPPYGNKETLSARNQKYVRQEEIKFRRFFDTVEASPLTGEQRRAAVVMEDRNLLVAAAGSGKTSAIIGKIGYILKKQYCESFRILVLAFNRKAAEELRERISRRLETGEIVVNTFHKCGLSIIAQAVQKKPSVAKWTINMEESPESNKVWDNIIMETAVRDGQFRNDFDALCLYFRWAVQPIYLFKSKNDYDQYLLSLRVKKSGGGDRDHWGAQTFQGQWVRSLEEVAIANWLYANGVKYRYEEPYPHAGANSQFRQYRPDFYYPEIDVYHEHFALDRNGNAPSFMPGYAEEAQRKRQLHAANQTVLIETTSSMFAERDIFAYLKKELSAHGIVFSRRPVSKISESVRLQFIKPLYGIIQSFLVHWKSSGLNEEQLRRKAENLSGFGQIRAKIFLRIMFRIKEEYQRKLISENEIDFEDMINRAAEYLRGGNYTHPYKIILVDEFQDVSQSRVRLIKAMLEQNPDCKLFAVGDDWQSIYRFAGADVSVMANFAEEFGETAANQLRNTFRSNQGIADTAAYFVSKNPSQLQKQVIAKDGNIQGVVQVVNYFAQGDEELFIESQLREIVTAEKRVKIYILARYNHLKPARLGKWQTKFGKTLQIEFSTIHRAKGREADYVFVVGMNSGNYSFPSEIEDDPVLRLVMPEHEKFKYAEERRLFYVALTRARYKVFLLAKKQNRSCFVDEILQNKNSVKESDFEKNRGGLGAPSALHKCPSCGGYLARRTGPHGVFWGCFNYPKCSHTQQNASN